MLDFLGAGERHSAYQKIRGGGLDAPVSKIMETWVHALDRKATIVKAIVSMRRQNFGGLPVLHRKKLAGFVTERDIVNRITGRTGLRVRDVMRPKPFFARDSYPLIDVAKMMVHGPYRRLPVVRDGILVGIVTPYDLLNYLNRNKRLRGLRRNKTPVRKAMNPNIIYTKPENKLHNAIETMQRHGVGGLPVVEGDEMDIVGIITERDVINLLV